MKEKKLFMAVISVLAFLLILAGGAIAEVGFLVSGGLLPDLPDEGQKMRQIFRETVNGEMAAEADYLNEISQDAASRLASLRGAMNRSQYFLYVDRNPGRQTAFVGFFNAANGNVAIIGLDKISSGNEKRKKFFITPTGVFKNSPDFIGYRALGTKNSKGWRGLGVRGSRVWDFGWQKTVKNGQERLIRFLLHATDPDFGEPRLGKVDSQGCVRISAKLNRFLDHYGLLDREYEVQKNDKRFSWVLDSRRQPVLFAGQYLLVGDSGNLSINQK